MKKIFYTILILCTGIILNSCDKDLLDKEPLDQIADSEFWNSDTDLELYVNSLYGEFEGWLQAGDGYSPFHDASTDIVVADLGALKGVESKQMDGTLTVPATKGGWDWSAIRKVNYFLENVGRVESGALVDHYTGEGYFFRAYFYFELLKRFGDLPIITQVLGADDEDFLFGTRSSRTEVVDFILSDLDQAISKMKFGSQIAPSRLNKDIAFLFKARVSLYEGTWEKYHQGTTFAGSTDGTAYMQIAADAAKAIIDNGNYAIAMGDPDEAYYRLFNQVDLSGNAEILFYKHYDGLAYGIDFANSVQNWPDQMGITQEMVQNYLCTDGLPYAVSPLFQGDKLLTEVEINRDPRLAQTIMVPGDVVRVSSNGDILLFTVYAENCPTGYESQKFRRPEVDPATGNLSGDIAFIFFRYAEALLVYAEAQAELGQLTQADVDLTINQLRDRVGMPHLTLGAITADPNWLDYGYTLPDYLHEIRRERVVELFGEGYRLDDLLRWRAHSVFLGKRPTGTFLTAEIEALYPESYFTNADGFIDPYQNILNGPNGGYGFNVERDYLLPIPSNELTLNPNLDQNPGW